MSRAGYCLDNQPIERFFRLLKSEYYYRKKFDTAFHLEAGLNRFIDYYNKRRVTLKFNGLTPLMFRNQYEMAS